MNRLKYIYINLNVACQVFQRGDCEIPPKTHTYHLTLEYSLLTLFFLLSPKENKVQKNILCSQVTSQKKIYLNFSQGNICFCDVFLNLARNNCLPVLMLMMRTKKTSTPLFIWLIGDLRTEEQSGTL